MIPTSPTQLWPALADAFPHRTFDADAQRMYLTNCLHVADYCPALKERIILLIVDKLIQIDVCCIDSVSFSASWNPLARERPPHGPRK
jgi:hypothetical protein